MTEFEDFDPIMKIGHSVLRFSSQEQIKGKSVERQIAQRDLICQRRGITLVEIYGSMTKAVSARKGLQRTKGDLKRLFDDLGTKIKPGEYLLVENLDRLSREDPRKAWKHFDAIIEEGVIVITTHNDREYSADLIKRQPWLMHELLGEMQRAYSENELKSTRIGDARERRRREASITGIKLSGHCPGWLEPIRDGKNVVGFKHNEGRVLTVKRIFALAVEGMGAWSIAKTLNAEGHAPFSTQSSRTLRERSGKKTEELWRSAIVSKIITGKAVLGHYEPKKLVEGKLVETDIIEGYYGDPVIETSVWLRANAARQGKDQSGASRKKRGKVAANLFNTVTVCDECAGPMRYKTYTGKTAKGTPKKPRKYLFCEGKMLGQGCTNNRKVNYDWVEETVLNHVRDFRLDELFDDDARKDESLRAIDNKIADITLKLKKLDKDAAKSKRLILDADNPEEEKMWRQHLGATLEAWKEAQNEVLVLQRKRAEVAHSIQACGNATETLERLLSELTTDDPAKRFIVRQRLSALLKTYITNIRFGDQFWTVILNGGLVNYRFSLPKLGGAPKKNPMTLIGVVDLRTGRNGIVPLGDPAKGFIPTGAYSPVAPDHRKAFESLLAAKPA